MMKELESRRCLSCNYGMELRLILCFIDHYCAHKYSMRKGQERHPFFCLPFVNFSSYFFTQKRYSGWPDPPIF